MNEAKEETGAPQRGGWMKKLIWAAGGLILLLVAAYFVVTSGGFVKGVVLPRVGAALNADLTAADIRLRPFSQIEIHELKLTPKGAEPLLTASLVRARYRLLSILGGNIVVEEVTVESPTVTLVEKADGTSNLDPLLKAQPQAPAKADSKSSPPPQIDIQSVAVKNASVKRTASLPSGGTEVIELSNLNLSAANLRNGGSGKLTLGAALAYAKSATISPANLTASLGGDFAFDLTADLQPARFNGKASLKIEKTGGSFGELSGLAAALDADASPTEVKQFALRFTQAGQPLGEVRVNGPFDLAKSEGKLNVAILSLDRRVLNLAGATSGLDFGTTVVNSTNIIELAKGGSVITASGQLDAAKVQIIRQGQTTPTLDLRGDYAVTVDNTAKSARLQTLNLTGTQNLQPLLRTELTAPMTIAWGDATNAVGDAALNVTLTRLNLADWRAFAAALNPAGVISATLKLVSQQGGQRLVFDLDANATELAASLGSNVISQADVGLRARGSVADLKQFKLDDYTIALAQRGQPAARISGSGTFDAATQDADLQVALTATLARLLAMFPQPDANFSGGTIELTGRVTKKAQDQLVVGKFGLASLTGNYGEFRFAEFGSTADLDVGMKGALLDIRKLNGELRSASNVGGKFDVSGNFDTERKAGQFALTLTDFNQNGLRPFLESALGDKKLVSVSLNTAATAKMEANGDAAVKANLHLANLVVHDPKGSLPATPLEAKVNVDAGVAKNVAQIRQCELTLTPTDRASNKLNVTGAVDYSKTNAITGLVKLVSDSLDVTRYYDLFAGDTKAAAPSTPAPATPSANTEPEPVKLPFANFTFEAGVGKFYLREVEATNLQFVAKLDRSHVLLKPAQLTLNGAPVNASADLDLSVPGYKYDVALNGSPIPLAPLVNSFVPERKGQLQGVTLANAQIKGAGVTGPNLRKNLSGQFGFASTNLNLSIANVRNLLINGVINVIVGIPDLIRNPTATLGNLLAGFRGGGAQGGFANELTAKPIDAIVMRGRVADGRVLVEQAEVKSTAFEVTTVGEITLADIPTNSAIHFPVRVSLSRPLAEKVGLAGNTPTNQPMAVLPDFLTMKGTLGKPERDIKALVLVGLATRAGLGVAEQGGAAIGGKVGDVLNALSGLAGGTATKPPATTNASGTVTTNQQPAQPVGDLIRGLGGLLGGRRTTTPTNAPATNPPANPK